MTITPHPSRLTAVSLFSSTLDQVFKDFLLETWPMNDLKVVKVDEK